MIDTSDRHAEKIWLTPWHYEQSIHPKYPLEGIKFPKVQTHWAHCFQHGGDQQVSGKSFCCLLPDESSSSSDSRNNPISLARIRWTGAAERGQFAESHFPGHLLLLEEGPCSLQWPIVPLQGHLRRQSQQQHNHIPWWS